MVLRNDHRTVGRKDLDHHMRGMHGLPTLVNSGHLMAAQLDHLFKVTDPLMLLRDLRRSEMVR